MPRFLEIPWHPTFCPLQSRSRTWDLVIPWSHIFFTLYYFMPFGYPTDHRNWCSETIVSAVIKLSVKVLQPNCIRTTESTGTSRRYRPWGFLKPLKIIKGIWKRYIVAAVRGGRSNSSRKLQSLIFATGILLRYQEIFYIRTTFQQLSQIGIRSRPWRQVVRTPKDLKTLVFGNFQ